MPAVRRADDEGDGRAARPRARGECEDRAAAERPCPFVTCHHHLYPARARPGVDEFEPAPGEETCALDVADRGGIPLEEVGTIFGVTRERVRQIEGKALARLRLRVDAGWARDMLAELPEGRVEHPGHTRAAVESGGDRAAPSASRGPAALGGPETVTSPAQAFWCGPLRARITGAVCGKRHLARVTSSRYGSVEPAHADCAACADGAAMRERLGDGPPGRRRLPVLGTGAAPAPAPSGVRWFGEDDEGGVGVDADPDPAATEEPGPLDGDLEARRRETLLGMIDVDGMAAPDVQRACLALGVAPRDLYLWRAAYARGGWEALRPAALPATSARPRSRLGHAREAALGRALAACAARTPRPGTSEMYRDVQRAFAAARVACPGLPAVLARWKRLGGPPA